MAELKPRNSSYHSMTRPEMAVGSLLFRHKRSSQGQILISIYINPDINTLVSLVNTGLE